MAEAKTDTASAFYRPYGLIPLPDTPNRLFLPMKTIERLILGPRSLGGPGPARRTSVLTAIS